MSICFWHFDRCIGLFICLLVLLLYLFDAIQTSSPFILLLFVLPRARRRKNARKGQSTERPLAEHYLSRVKISRSCYCLTAPTSALIHIHTLTHTPVLRVYHPCTQLDPELHLFTHSPQRTLLRVWALASTSSVTVECPC